jgi:hypothetical protein
MGFYVIFCDQCDYTKRLSQGLRSYEFADGQRLTIKSTFAWCSSCNDIVWAETMPGVSELQSQLEETTEDLAHITEGDEGDWRLQYHKWIKDLNLRIEWRKGRVSPPKCLQCASTSILSANQLYDEPADNDYWRLEHPDCGGTIDIRSGGLSLNRLWLIYTPEGDRIT